MYDIGIEDNYVKVFSNIECYAKKWLTLVGCSDFASFANWLIRGQALIIAFNGGYVILDEYVPNVRVTAHPCFIHKDSFLDKELLEEVLRSILQVTNVHRLQIRVTETAGHTLRKRLADLGFSKEATLQKYTINTTVVPPQLCSVDIWVILK